jgi:hypothetical protein
MRGKLIAVYSIVVLITGLLAFALMRASLDDVLSNADRARQEASRAAAGANARLQVEGLLLERWLGEQVMAPRIRDPFLADTPQARSESATSQANELYSRVLAALPGTNPTLVAFVDEQGVALGRNGSGLMRGEALGKTYPSLLDAIKRSSSGSDLWVNRSRNEQLLASFCAVRDDKGKVLGAVIVGTAVDEGRLSTISELTSNGPVALVAEVDSKLELVAKSRNAPAPGVAAITQESFKPGFQKAIGAPRPVDLHGSNEELMTAGYGLSGYGDGKRAVLVGFAPVAMFGDVTGMLLPIFGATAVGIVMAILCAVLLGGYIIRPIVALEEGLLAIINGDTNRRFELEHAEVGGLISRINTLLDTLMGVEEDTTDSEGRPSQAPSASNFRDAIGVDQSQKLDFNQISALRNEAPDAYYARLFAEYIQAKRSIGDPVDHITQDLFVQRIQANEKETSERQGKPVRFRVELQGREVKLIAVPLE